MSVFLINPIQVELLENVNFEVIDAYNENYYFYCLVCCFSYVI